MQAARVRLGMLVLKDMDCVWAIVGDGVHSWMDFFWIRLT